MFYRMKDLPQQFVTPKYSKAFGGLITGQRLEVGWLRFGAGEGAVAHAHPHEQVMVVVSGRLRVRLGDETTELGPSEAFLAPPNVEHQVTAIEDTEVISSKNLIDGVGHKI